MEVRARLQRILDLYHPRTEVLAHLFHYIFEVSLFTVHLVECENDRFFQFGCSAEDILSADLHAVFGVHKNQTHVAYSQGGVCVAHEVIRSGAVDDIQFLSVELRVEYGGEYRVSILLLYGEIVGNCVAGIYRAATFYHTTLVDHRFRECGFTRAL